jgi:putative transposase
MKRTVEGAAYRTSVVPVTLSQSDYSRAHEAAHASALMWNSLLEYQREFWAEKLTDPTTKQRRHHLAAVDPALQILHSHTRQAIVEGVEDALTTFRSNRKLGIKGRAPHRIKNYRPLVFTRNFGWRLRPDGRLNLSLGRGRAGIIVPLPTVEDSLLSTENNPVLLDPALWGEIQLCWNIQARQWSLHIAYQSVTPLELDPTKIMAIDPGIINPMTTAVATNFGYEVVIVNGREARWLKQTRNKGVAALTSRMSKATKDSNQWRKLNRAKKKLSADTARRLRNIDHQISRKVARVAQTHNTGTIAMGDTRGIEQRTRQAAVRRFGKDQRRRLSQWSRGTQARYLAEKTGVTLTYTNEAYSSKTCPACLTRNVPTGRQYQCHDCGFTCHRDAVGAINILMRATHGTYRRIDPDAIIRVIHLRATPLKRSAKSKAQNRAVKSTTHEAVLTAA